MPTEQRPWQGTAVKAALASAEIPPLLARGGRTALAGLWLGILSDASLQALDERYYDEANEFKTPEWNERGLFGWEASAIYDHFEPGARIVVTACGGGREVLALLEAGFDAVGFESHPELLAFAREFLAERGHPRRAQPAQRDEFPEVPVPYDGAVIGWGAYSLIQSRERRVHFLTGSRRGLSPGAPVLVSFFDRPTEGRELRWGLRIANRLRRLRRAAPLELGDTLAPTLVHIFTREQFASEAADAGFDVADYRIAGAAEGSNRYACAILRAR